MSNQMERNKPDNTQQDSLSTKGRWPVFIKLFAVCGVTSALGEIIGTFKVPVGPGSLIILPMIFAMILAVLITPVLDFCVCCVCPLPASASPPFF